MMTADHYTDRKYAARRIDKGVYVQPSNDGQRLYVITRDEDGREYGLESGPEVVVSWSWGLLDQTIVDRVQRIASFDPYDALAELRGDVQRLRSRDEA